MTPPRGELLDIQGLRVEFSTYRGVVKALNGADLWLDPGEKVSVVGETGCGKSVTALAVMRLIEEPGGITGGRILFKGRDLAALPEPELNTIRGRQIAMIFQEPVAALNPTMRVGYQIAESLQGTAVRVRPARVQAEVERLLAVVGLDWERVIRLYPHELSGGMAQRVMIAMALASNPALLIADEPTSALDVTIQIQILELLNGLVRQFRNAVLLITHAMGVAAFFSDRIAVMYAGNVVEFAPTAALFAHPAHPYTQGLLRAVPRIGLASELAGIPGTVPDLVSPPSGCRFHPRCPQALASCAERMPALRQIAPAHHVACYLYGEER